MNSNEAFRGSRLRCFSPHGVSARKVGANELNAEFGGVSCYRAPEYG